MAVRPTLVGVAAATGLLAGCASAAPNASAIAACNADTEAVVTAAQAYQAQVGAFPTSIDALARATPTAGPWLREVPSTKHYTIFLDSQTGSVYVYPPGTKQPTSYDRSHRAFDLGDPCRSFASS